MMRKMIDAVMIFAALAAAVFVFQKLDVEEYLLNKAQLPAVSQAQMEVDVLLDAAGMPAGEGVTELTEIGQWEDILSEADYVTVTPVSVVKTDVSTLAKWESFFNKNANGTTGNRRDEVVEGGFHMPLIYTPVYVIELPDGSHVLAQMSRCYADRIEKGEQVTLPLGTRMGMLDETRSLLREDMEKYGTPDDYILYTLNNQWQGEYADTILFVKLGAAAAAGLVLAVALLMIVDGIFTRKEKSR